jgi:hypothetical protein
MGEDARGFLVSIVPIVLRMSVYIVNLDTKKEARDKIISKNVDI